VREVNNDRCVRADSRLRVLIVASAVGPQRGSEPGMGWNWIKALSSHHDLWVITGEREGNREAIHDALIQEPELHKHLHITFIPRPDPPRTVKLWPPLYYYYYRKWHETAFAAAKSLAERVSFDLAHQLNMIGYREPGYLWKLPLPFVWGPIGGHVQMPWRFLASLGMRDGAFYTCRNLINAYQMRTARRVKCAIDRASTVIAATKEDKVAIERFHQREAILLSETGTVLPDMLPAERTRHDGRPLKICWCGMFAGRKALPLALRAIARARQGVTLEFHIIGDGPQSGAWRKMATKLGLEKLCHWHGSVARDKALSLMGSCDCLLFTSLQEGTPHVVLEALSLGLPVLCHDACGHGESVDETCGVKIPVRDPQHSIEGFAQAICRLALDHPLLRKLSEGARARATECSWSRKASQMSEIYQNVLGGTQSRSWKEGPIVAHQLIS